jgi:PAS domain S-box-containing protein
MMRTNWDSFHWRTLQVRIAFATLAIFLVGILTMAFYSSRALQQDMARMLGDQQFSIVTIIAADIDLQLTDRKTLLQEAAGIITPAVLASDRKIQAFLEDRPNLQKMFNAGAFVTRLDGTPIADVPVSADRLGRNVMDRDYMVAALTRGETSIGKPVLGKSLGTPVFSIASPIRDERGKVIGAIVGVVNLGKANFLDKISANHYGETGDYILASPQHRLFITSNDKRRIMQPIPDAGVVPAVDRFVAGYEGSLVFSGAMGVEVLASAKQIPASGWVMVATLPTEEAFAPIRAMKLRNALIALAVALLAGLLIWQIAGRMVRQRLAPLLAATQKLALLSETGLAPQPLPVTSPDEIGELVAGFNRLLESARQREESLRVSEEKHRILLDEASDPIFTLSPNGEYRYVNTAFTIPFVRSPDDIIGKTLWDVFPKEEADKRFGLLQWIVEHGTGKAIEVSIPQPGGDRYLITTAKPIFNDQQKVTSILCISKDVTEIKNAEAAARAANSAKSEFLANMSHEIRTPMNGVIGMIDIMQQTDLKPEQHRMLDTIHDSSVALLNILNDILDYSMIEAGKLTIEQMPTHLREVAEGVALLMVTLSQTNAIELSVFVSPELPAWIISDPNRLRQVLINLVGNAIKFTANKADCPGRVMLLVEPHQLINGSPGVQLRVIDNGVGISRDALDKLFRPFTQADQSTARKFGGTGLGLSISRRLVQLMGGEITARSTLGEGSDFIVELPLRESAPGRALPPAPNLAGVHVLIPTSDESAALILPAYCRAAGADVSLLDGPEAARQLLRKSPPTTPTILLLGLEITTPASEFDLPSSVEIVRMVCRGKQVSADEVNVFIRPLVYHELIEGIAIASGLVAAPENLTRAVRQHPSQSPYAPAIDHVRTDSNLILLAEDNETNRDVMQEQLRILGYSAECAEDGVEALRMWRSGHYALLLTDCHMPNMDGFQLTAAIRQDEIAEGQGRHSPIIAVTANAMYGESERCRARGMDDYLPKPLRLNELGPTLAKWLPQTTATTTDTSSGNDAESKTVANGADDSLAIWDTNTLVRLMGNNPAMHNRLLEKFLLSADDQVSAIAAATATADAALTSSLAHKLKSAARTVGALQLGDLCEKMEFAGREGNAPACIAFMQPLKATYASTTEQIRSHLGK